MKLLNCRKPVMFFAVLIWAITAVYPMGILTPFTECRLENVMPGKSYVIKSVNNKPLKIKNTGNTEVIVKIEVLRPSRNDLKDNYKQIPDVSWVSIEEDSLKILPGSWGQAKVFIKVPKNKAYYGNKYQAYLLIKTEGEGRIQAGLKSRILFTVEKKKGVIKRIWKKMWK